MAAWKVTDVLPLGYPATASEFILIGKETERGWEQAEDSSTLLPSLKRYQRNTGTAQQSLHERSQKMSLGVFQKETRLSRNTIVRSRRGQRVHRDRSSAFG